MKALTVLASAAFLGVMLVIGLALVPIFLVMDPQVFEDWFARYFVFLLVPVILTSMPAFVGAFVLRRRSPAGSTERRLWRDVLLALAVTYAVSTIIHLPLNIALWSRDLSDPDIRTTLGWWSAAHVLRIIGALVASRTAYRAIAPAEAPIQPVLP